MVQVGIMKLSKKVINAVKGNLIWLLLILLISESFVIAINFDLKKRVNESKGAVERVNQLQGVVNFYEAMMVMQQNEDPFIKNFNWHISNGVLTGPKFVLSLLVRQKGCTSCMVNEALRWATTMAKYDPKLVQLVIFTDSTSHSRIKEIFHSADERYLVCALSDFDQCLAELHVKQIPLILFSQFSSKRIIYSHLPGLKESLNDDFQRKIDVFLTGA